MADEKVDWDAFYRDVGITRKEGQGLTTRKVNTVAVDPFTGKPLGSSGAPPNEVVVPGGTNTGLGYQSGQSFPDSYRLLPTGPLAVAGETPATRAIQTASPDLRGMVVNPLSRDSVAQRTAGLGFRPPVMDNGAFGVPMSKTMQAILANDPSYAAQRGVIPQSSPQVAQAMAARASAPHVSSDGYVYQNGKTVGKADWAKDLTPSQQYDTANQMARDKAVANAKYKSQSTVQKARDGSWATGAVSGSPFW